jgi:hypothetical protein
MGSIKAPNSPAIRANVRNISTYKPNSFLSVPGWGPKGEEAPLVTGVHLMLKSGGFFRVHWGDLGDGEGKTIT